MVNERDYVSFLPMMQLDPLVPVHQFDKLPSYYIFAGLVFIPLTQPYLHEYGEDWYNTCPRRLCERALRELPKKAGEQLVILSQVCMPFLVCVWTKQVETIGTNFILVHASGADG